MLQVIFISGKSCSGMCHMLPKCLGSSHVTYCVARYALIALESDAFTTTGNCLEHSGEGCCLDIGGDRTSCIILLISSFSSYLYSFSSFCSPCPEQLVLPSAFSHTASPENFSKTSRLQWYCQSKSDILLPNILFAVQIHHLSKT